MNFMGLLKSLDELLYEVMSWIVFFPMTLWRVLRRPLTMMDYSDRELHQSAAEQYTDTLRPPLFLFLALLLSHALELAFIGSNELLSSKRGLAALVDDDTSLVLLRLVIFSVFPLLFAVRLVRAQRKRITRDSLRQPFYAQCYAAAAFALTVGIGGLFATTHHWGWSQAVGWALNLFALLVYGIVQARWFAAHLKRSLAVGFGHASIAMVESLILLALILPLFA